jgi:hypothetical protein
LSSGQITSPGAQRSAMNGLEELVAVIIELNEQGFAELRSAVDAIIAHNHLNIVATDDLIRRVEREHFDDILDANMSEALSSDELMIHMVYEVIAEIHGSSEGREAFQRIIDSGFEQRISRHVLARYLESHSFSNRDAP